MFNKVIEFIRCLYPNKDLIPLHEPTFTGREKEYVNYAIDSTFVSSVGEFVNRFEDMICSLTGAKFAVAAVNGTNALHIALKLSGVSPGDEVITQPLTFIATANAISYCCAIPIFIDVDLNTLGMSPEALSSFLDSHTHMTDRGCINKTTGRRISACVPMHTFGHPCRIDSILEICNNHKIKLVEDAAESLGSIYKNKHTGTFGLLGIYSFNGNKTVTCGGGGIIVTDDEFIAKKGKHLTTTAKIPHPYEFVHDEVGYNYRLPNLNAALGCAQLEKLEFFLKNKRSTAESYKTFFENTGIKFITEPEYANSNYWLNGIILENSKMRDEFLKATNSAKIMTRPLWKLIHKLEMYKKCQHDKLINAIWLEERIVNIPSSVRLY
ncbi:MAG: LegC family aminotransferase [Desulfobacterales bacterium]|nr:LegC family aminotransferase [Desulfobacterales bacterium]MBF0397361.1 LegC family aminotransferase [Desulfobacterales bacterium]